MGGMTLLTAVWRGAWLEPVYPRVVRAETAIRKLPPEQDGLVIAVLSDFHFRRPEPVMKRVAGVIRREKPDLVVVASPTIFHKDQIIAAFRAGADVFAEKPLTAEVAETQAIVAEMEKTGRKLMVYQPRRLDKDCLQAQEIINSGVLGKIHQLRRNVRNYSRRNDWQALSRFAGGMLNNYGVHYMDQACFAAGSFAVKCEYCELRRINALGDAEDFVKVILRNQDNVKRKFRVHFNVGFTF